MPHWRSFTSHPIICLVHSLLALEQVASHVCVLLMLFPHVAVAQKRWPGLCSLLANLCQQETLVAVNCVLELGHEESKEWWEAILKLVYTYKTSATYSPHTNNGILWMQYYTSCVVRLTLFCTVWKKSLEARVQQLFLFGQGPYMGRDTKARGWHWHADIQCGGELVTQAPAWHLWIHTMRVNAWLRTPPSLKTIPCLILMYRNKSGWTETQWLFNDHQF